LKKLNFIFGQVNEKSPRARLSERAGLQILPGAADAALKSFDA